MGINSLVFGVLGGLVVAAKGVDAAPFDAVETVGSERFRRQATDALGVLERRAPAEYRLVGEYVGRIRQGSRSGMWAYEDPPTFEVGDRTAFHSLSWFAGAIVHDACHSKQYHDHAALHGTPVPDEAWMGKRAERECIERQRQALRKIGAPAHELDHLGRQDGGHYDSDGDGKATWGDYRRRDW